MSGNVISLPEKKEPHGEGAARCIECGHKWQAVAPIGTYSLECPNCHTLKGAWMGVFQPATRWICECGNDLYFIAPKGMQCAKCGKWAEGF